MNNVFFLQLEYKIKNEPNILLLLNFYKHEFIFLEQNNENIKYSLKIETHNYKNLIKNLNKIKTLKYIITNNNLFYSNKTRLIF